VPSMTDQVLGTANPLGKAPIRRSVAPKTSGNDGEADRRSLHVERSEHNTRTRDDTRKRSKEALRPPQPDGSDDWHAIEESPSMPETIHPEDLPAIIEKRKLDEHAHASVMDNGVIVIGSQTGGIEIILDAKRAFALLELLYDHNEKIYSLRSRFIA
jgi:hypothetical protein